MLRKTKKIFSLESKSDFILNIVIYLKNVIRFILAKSAQEMYERRLEFYIKRFKSQTEKYIVIAPYISTEFKPNFIFIKFSICLHHPFFAMRFAT